MKSVSWVVREKTTKAVIFETFDKAKVEALNTRKYEAVPILDYLMELNTKIKKGEMIMETNKEQGLKMREFRIQILTNPPVLEMKLFGVVPERKWITIKGYTLEDAKRRAGIQ